MDQRKMMLPDGWYPHSQAAAENRIKNWEKLNDKTAAVPAAGIVPHAGWDFSGAIAWKIISAIPGDTDLVVAAGGHLPVSAPSRFLDYSTLETPFGELAVSDLAGILCSEFLPDADADNTVEIQLPLIKYHLPDVKVLPVRLAANRDAAEWGALVSRYCREQNIKVFFLGSTDLSHYGARFGYTLFGSGKGAKDQIRNLDNEYLNLLNTMEADKALKHSLDHYTACSAGSAAGACSFAAERGITGGEIIEHRYSYEIYSGGSDFVGYGSVLYRC
ncbi:MAG: AmmeMemoRadiSam system protein B [Spirochaetales bacterium]|nr:AmmeMemoRadiSam system protein B [Spirochaetales bacterium]